LSFAAATKDFFDRLTAKPHPMKLKPNPKKGFMNGQDLTHQEVGAFLQAVGSIMQSRNCCAAEVVDGTMDHMLVATMVPLGIEEARADALCALDLGIAIDYVMAT